MTDTPPESLGPADPALGAGAGAEPSVGEDRLVGLDPVEGFAFESDGAPIGELDVDAPDSLFDRAETVAEQAVDERSWRFGHVIVDEAQDLTPMQWRMIARRSANGAVTLVGDLAQRAIGQPGQWVDHLPPSFQGFALQELTVNYRSPAEINDLAAAVLAELAPDLARPRSIRSSGRRPDVVELPDLSSAVGPWVESRHRARSRAGVEGRMAVIGVDLEPLAVPGVVWLTPWKAKGLEFDSVTLVEPADIVDQPRGLALLYVALTRTTDELTIVHQRPLPPILAEHL